MSANEIAERFAAACWVKFGSLGGEATNELAVSQVAYRSRCGFTDRIYTTIDATAIPLFILPLDRVFSRKETAVFARRLGTVAPIDGSRVSYPLMFTPPEDTANLSFQPMLMAWMGDDLTNPAYLPFGLSPTGGVVPDGYDLDLYDAIAILLPVGDLGALSGDVCVFVTQHPKPDTADAPIVAALPAEPPPDPILALNPVAWWRMDDYLVVDGGEGETVVSFNPRSESGDEGALELAVPVLSPLAPDVLADNQPSFKDTGNALTPQGPLDWNFLGSDAWTAYVVFYPTAGGAGALQNIITSATLPPTPQYEVSSDLAGDAFTTSFPEYGVDPIGLFWAAAEDVLQRLEIFIQPTTPNWFVQSTTAGNNSGDFITPPPDTADKPLFNNLEAGGELAYCEIMIFAYALDSDQRNAVATYLTERYPSI